MKFAGDVCVSSASAAILPSVSRPVRGLTAAVSLIGAVVVVAGGCSAPMQPAAPPVRAPSSAPKSPIGDPTSRPTVASQIDPRWMGTGAGQPWNWEELNRRVTSDFQQFGYRPVGETEIPRRCNGCGVNPPTAYLTVYAAGAFDPTDARTGQPVSVIGDDGFFRASEGLDDAELAWQYAENAWATVRGTTTVTSNLDRMLELARGLRPTERTPIRVPFRVANVPDQMPLAQISRTDYGATALLFGACGMTDAGAVPKCMVDFDNLSVQIGPDSGSYHDRYVVDSGTVPWQIGGKNGRYDAAKNRAAVQIQDRMLAEFVLDGPPGGANPTTQQVSLLKDILATVEWASDPGNDATWRAIIDWVK